MLFHVTTSTEPREDFSKTNKTIAVFGVTLTYIFQSCIGVTCIMKLTRREENQGLSRGGGRGDFGFLPLLVAITVINSLTV